VVGLRKVLGQIEAAGVEPDAILQAAGIAPEIFTDPDGRVAAPKAGALWEEALRVTGDPNLGLHMAERRSRGSAGLFDYCLHAAPTLGDSLQRACRYFRLLHDGIALALEVGAGPVATLRVDMPPLIPRAIPELILASFVVGIRASGDHDWAPLEVRFVHGPPADEGEHRRIFRSKISFSASMYALRIHQADLAAPTSGADPGLLAVLDRHAEDLLQRLPQQGSFVDEVRAAVAKELCGGNPGVEPIAQRLGVSSRTLHRRLAERSITFKALVDELRRELAIGYLDQGDRAIGEVAFLLGYSETSAFHRAFRRWTGNSPTQHRTESRRARAERGRKCT